MKFQFGKIVDLGISGIPGFAELAANFPGGPEELNRVLNQPQVLDFIINNPDVIQKFTSEGLPSADKLQALLAIAAPTPEGAEQGIFGPDIFAGKIFIFLHRLTYNQAQKNTIHGVL